MVQPGGCPGVALPGGGVHLGNTILSGAAPSVYGLLPSGQDGPDDSRSPRSPGRMEPGAYDLPRLLLFYT